MSMTIEAWELERHAPLLAAWYRDRGMASDAGVLSTYPRTGFIVGGIIAGFVYITDSSVAIVDQWVSCPESSPEDRRMASELLLIALEGAAREAGALFISLCTPVGTVTSLAESRGYIVDRRPHHYALRSL